MEARAAATPEGAAAPLGIHHPVSHHGDTPEGIAEYAKLTTYHVTKLAEFAGKLQASKDGDGSTANLLLALGDLAGAEVRKSARATGGFACRVRL